MNCGDCGVVEGEFHKENCDQEICSVCKRQRLMCVHLSGGCDMKEREPHIQSPVITCARCGKLYPNFWMVPDNDWKQTCGLTYDLNSVLCWGCFEGIRRVRKLPFIGKRGVVF